MTEQEKVILQSIDPKFKYIARDGSGILYVYSDRPKKLSTYWNLDFGFAELGGLSHLFKSVSWEDEEPTLIEDLLNPKPSEEILINKTMVYKLLYWKALLKRDSIHSNKGVISEINNILENYKEVKE